MSSDFLLRPGPARRPSAPDSEEVGRGASIRPIDVHRRLPGYAPSPMLETEALARRLGLGRVFFKVERSRFGLPSFKLLGASWAVYRALGSHLGMELEPWKDVTELAAKLRPALPISLAAATDGNHGRAVARMARLLGLGATIFVPRGTAAARISAIRAEGADCTVVDGDYDAAVARAAAEADERTLVISDTAWPGYETVPAWVQEGYATLFDELDAQLAAIGGQPTHVLVPIGVGALGAACVRHVGEAGHEQSKVVGVEPLGAACVLASLREGRPVSVPESDPPPIMVGLNCATPSLTAWPWLASGIDAMIAIADERAEEGMRLLATLGVATSETGAAALGGLLELTSETADPSRRDALNLDATAQVAVLVTEGVTDPDAYLRIVGRRPELVEAGAYA
jgi:diaminopropionate ammonia-lyase